MRLLFCGPMCCRAMCYQLKVPKLRCACLPRCPQCPSCSCKKCFMDCCALCTCKQCCRLPGCDCKECKIKCCLPNCDIDCGKCCPKCPACDCCPTCPKCTACCPPKCPPKCDINCCTNCCPTNCCPTCPQQSCQPCKGCLVVYPGFPCCFVLCTPFTVDPFTKQNAKGGPCPEADPYLAKANVILLDGEFKTPEVVDLLQRAEADKAGVAGGGASHTQNPGVPTQNLVAAHTHAS